MATSENTYISLRNAYLPEKIKVVFVLESPPEGHGYVYDPSGRVSEVLFRAFMKVINYKPTDKHEGLKQLQSEGMVLVNPIYVPVNKLPDKEADKIILNNYDNFIEDLSLLIDKQTPIILVKSNILKLLENKLIADGFNVLNNGILVPFPLHYHAESFQEKVSKMLKAI